MSHKRAKHKVGFGAQLRKKNSFPLFTNPLPLLYTVAMIRVFVSACIALLVAGCGAAPAATAVRSSVIDALPTAAATATTAPSASPADAIVIRFERSGGFAGRTTSYSIRADGTVLVGAPLTRDPAQTLPVANTTALADLLAKVAATNIVNVASGDYSPANSCCDRYAYSLSLTLAGGTYTYTTVEAAQNQPDALAETIELVQGYIQAAQ